MEMNDSPKLITAAAKLIPVPPGLALQPVDPVRGFHVPWFVSWVDGKPEWRFADAGKRVKAVRDKLCWVCGGFMPGDLMSKRCSFILGPMCVVNRISAEPPMHRECALYSVLVCPFMTRPKMERRRVEEDVKEELSHPGMMIMRNPGVSIVWDTNSYKTVSDGDGGFLMRVGEPLKIEAYREGRIATLDEIEESLVTGLPRLEEACRGLKDQLAAPKMAVAIGREVLGLPA